MTSRFPFRPLLILLAMFYTGILSRSVFAPLLPVIQGEFGLSHGEAGSVFLFVACGVCVGLFGSGFVASRLNHRRTILLSAITLGGVMLAISQSTSISGIHAGLLLVGACAGLYFPSGVATLTNLAGREHWGKALAIHEMAPNLAFITAPLLVEALLRIAPWRGIVRVLGVSSMLMSILFFLFGPKGSQKGDPPNPRALQKILQNGSFWTMGAVFALSIGAESGVYSMLPLFLVNEMGFERELANALVGFSRVSGVLILFFSGVITDRIGYKRATIWFLAVVGTLTLMLGVLQGRLVTPAVIILQAASLPCFFPGALAFLSLIFPHHLRSLGMALVLVVGILFGLGVIPPSIGYLAETLSFSFGFSVLGVLLLAMVPVLFAIRTYSEAHQ